MELKSRGFLSAHWMTEFVNQNKITQDNIQSIHISDNGYTTLLWWEVVNSE